MKSIRAIGLSFAVLLCNNVQSMELPSKYPLEEQLLNGDITVEQYLLILEQTTDFGWMLHELRTVDYMNEEDLYADFIDRIKNSVKQIRKAIFKPGPDMQQKMAQMGLTREKLKKRMLKQLYNLRQAIPGKHEILKDWLREDLVQRQG